MAKSIIFGTTPEFLARDGLIEAIRPWEDGLRAETGPGTFEWWYFDAHFSDQSTAVIVFATKPILERNGALKPNVSLTITRPDGTKLSGFPIFPSDQFNASKETCDVSIGPNWAKGDLHTYQLHVEMENPSTSSGTTPSTGFQHGERKTNRQPDSSGTTLSADLSFTGLVPPWRPGAGNSYFGDTEHYFAWLPSIPHGMVEGTLTYDGQTHPVSGTGYHDHNWGNVGLHEVMDHWYWGRAHIGEYTLIYVEQIAAKEYGYTRMPVFMLAKGDQLLTGESRWLTMKTSNFIPHPSGRAYPQEVDFHWQDGKDSIDLSLRKPKMIEAVSLLQTFPAWRRALIRLFANPYYFRFYAEMVLSMHLGELTGIEYGRALFEIMILQGKNHP